jgi:sugar phosphate permease
MAKMGMAVGAATLWACAGLFWTVPQVCGLLVLLGLATLVALAYAASMPPWFALLTELAPRRSRGFTLAYFGTAHGLGASVAVLLGGVVWDLRHEAVFMVAAVGLTLCVVLAVIAVGSE